MVLCALLVLALWTWVLSRPFSELFSRWGSDDALYYTRIAANIWHGHGSSFDGVHLTNGFQPLYLAILLLFVPLYEYDVVNSVLTTMWLNAALSFLAAIPLYQLFKKVKSKSFALALVVFILLHPKWMSIALQGTEAALILAVMAFVLWHWHKKRRGEAHAFPVLAMLLVFTRIDLSILLGVLGLADVLQRQSFLAVLKNYGLAVAGILTWFSINFLAFGHVMPDSGVAKHLHAQAYEIEIAKELLAGVHTVLQAESAMSWFMAALAVLGFWRLIIERRNPNLPAFFWPLVLAGCGILAAAVVHLKGYRDWYLVPLWLAACFWVMYGLELVVLRFGKSTLYWIVVGGLVLLWTEAQWKPRSFNGTDSLLLVKRMREHVPDTAKVGAFNAGVFAAALQPSMEVVNVDGVVNHSVLRHLEERTLEVYFRNERITYLLDRKASVDFFLSRFCSQPIHRKVVHETTLGGVRYVLLRLYE